MDIAIGIVEENLLPAGHRPSAIVAVSGSPFWSSRCLNRPRYIVGGGNAIIAAAPSTGLTHLARCGKPVFEVLFGEMELGRPVGHETTRPPGYP